MDKSVAQNWIRRVQRSSDGVKRVWLVLLSGGAMLLIIFFWIVYVSFTMPRPKAEDAPAEASVPQEGMPFWKVLGEGIKVISGTMAGRVENVKEGVGNFKNTVMQTITNFSNDFTIKGGTEND